MKPVIESMIVILLNYKRASSGIYNVQKRTNLKMQNLQNVRNSKSAVRRSKPAVGRFCFSDIFSHTIRTSVFGGRGVGGECIQKQTKLGKGVGWGGQNSHFMSEVFDE